MSMGAWELKCVEETLWMRSGFVNPREHPNEVFALYSMPAYDAGMEPELLPGRDIGSSKKGVEPGDCLLSKLNPRIPRVWIVGPGEGRRQISSTDFVALVDRKRPRGEPWFEPAFLRYMLLSSGFRQQVIHDVQGATGSRQRLRRDDINAAVLPVPPLDEQRRVVARIEELFARIEEARRLRAAVNQDSEELMQAALAEVFPRMHEKLPPGWDWTALEATAGESGLFTDGDWILSNNMSPDGEVRLIQLADVGVGAFLDRSSKFITREKSHELNCTLLQTGDVLISRMASPIARACIVPDLSQAAITAVDVTVLRLDPEIADSRFIMHSSGVGGGVGAAERCSAGSGVSGGVVEMGMLEGFK